MCLLVCLLAAAGCEKLSPGPPASVAPEAPPQPPPEPPSRASAAAAAPARYAVPFAWETSPEEPLAQAREFMSAVLRTNAGFVRASRPRRPAAGDTEPARATVLTCADAGVQTDAWGSPRDAGVFTVRNLGNQLETALGSIQYGVEHLHTPVLMVVGHTGCAAVQAALTRPPGLGAHTLEELGVMKLPAAAAASAGDVAWAEAVVANVHAQVSLAVQSFGALVHSGELTVIGAVHDARGDLGAGRGQLLVVNVNTNQEAQRVEAFVKAVEAGPGRAGSTDRGSGRASADERIRAIIERTESSMLTAGAVTAAAHRSH